MTCDLMQEDGGDLMVSKDELEELISIMRRQESTTYLRKDYLSSKSDDDNVVHAHNHFLDASWRQRIIEWMFGVVDTCGLRRDSVAIAAYYLDLCVERNVIHSRQDFQLAAMTALQLAIKLYDSTVMKLDSMVKLGRGLFSEQDVIEMESKMLSALQWQVHPPTPVCYLRQFLRVPPRTVTPLTRYILGEVTRFIAEISVCIYNFVRYPPSVIAYAGMLIAMERIDEFELPAQQRQEIFDAMKQMAKLDHSSPQVIEAVRELRSSLEKNVSIQDLIDSIDAQCHDGAHKMKRQRSKMERRDSGFSQSPRDVVVTGQRRH